jgi:hypothetical protein
MKYEDVLASGLDRLRRGAAIDDLVAEQPRVAEQLRADLTAAASAGAVSARLPAPSAEARARFQRDLQAQRRAAAAPAASRGGWFGRRLALPALAATAAALLVAAVLVSGIIAPTDTAEASIEGIVLDNDGSAMTLQTETGLQTVAVDRAQVACDDTASCIGPGSLEPGQLIVIRGTREARRVVAQRIELRAYGDVAYWCDRFPGQCAAVETALSQRADRCDQSAVACQHIRSRLEEIRSQIASSRQIGDLRSRCGEGVNAACRELQDRCSNNRPACAAIRDFLRNRKQ